MAESPNPGSREHELADLLDDGHEEEWPCTHCAGEGLCMDGTDPLGNCPDEPHRCHACGGSGNRRDQRIF